MILTLLLVLGGCHASFAQNLLVNGTFDTGITGWVVDPSDPGGAEWDPTLGQPPGALSLTGEYQRIFPEPCYLAVPGTYRFRADAYMKTNGDGLFCSIEWALYHTEDCSDSYAIIVSPPVGSWVLEMNQWESLSFDRPGLQFLDGTKAVRPYLGKAIDENGDDACVFDNVYFEIIPTPVTSVPAVSSVGLAVLTVLLGLAGFVVLRRRIV